MTAIAQRPRAAFASSSTRRAAAIPLPTITSGSLTAYPSSHKGPVELAPQAGRAPLCLSNPCFGKTRRARFRRALAQVEPPGHRQAGRVESKIDDQRQLRAAGDGNRLAEAARDQIAATSTDRADEAERGGALDAGSFQSQCPARFALALGFSKIFLAEDRRN